MKLEKVNLYYPTKTLFESSISCSMFNSKLNEVNKNWIESSSDDLLITLFLKRQYGTEKFWNFNSCVIVFLKGRETTNATTREQEIQFL